MCPPHARHAAKTAAKPHAIHLAATCAAHRMCDSSWAGKGEFVLNMVLAGAHARSGQKHQSAQIEACFVFTQTHKRLGDYGVAGSVDSCFVFTSCCIAWAVPVRFLNLRPSTIAAGPACVARSYNTKNHAVRKFVPCNLRQAVGCSIFAKHLLKQNTVRLPK